VIRDYDVKNDLACGSYYPACEKQMREMRREIT